MEGGITVKKIIVLTLSFILMLSFTSCSIGDGAAGGGDSEILGSLVYFYGDDKYFIDCFSSQSTEEKTICLAKDTTYRIELRPSFRGSKSSHYLGDCAKFSCPDLTCDIKYIGNEYDEPKYEFIIRTDKNFQLTVTVDNYTQKINIVVV